MGNLTLREDPDSPPEHPAQLIVLSEKDLVHVITAGPDGTIVTHQQLRPEAAERLLKTLHDAINNARGAVNGQAINAG